MNETPDRSLNPVLAFLANFVVLALGYVYVGRIRLAWVVVAALMVTVSVASWSRLIFTQTGFFVTAALLISITIVPLVHSPIIALREKKSAPKKYNTWWSYVGWIVASIVLAQTLPGLRPVIFGYNVFRLPSQSMSPTLLAGDFVITDTWVPEEKGPRFGELYVFDIGDAQGTMYLKRIVGLPGDSLEIRDAKLFRNGEAIDEPYVADVDSPMGMGKEFGPVTLGESQYFVLGDNRTRSKDSRYLGPVPADQLHGLVRMRWFSYDGGVRWDRFPFVFE